MQNSNNVVKLYTKEYILTNTQGSKVGICNFGAAITQFCINNKNGQPTNVVLGFEDINNYQYNDCFLGVTAGRYANRIAQASFNLEGQTYKLSANNGNNCLHGGKLGFYNQVWQLENLSQNSITLSYLSLNLEEGFPGDVQVFVTFSLNDLNELAINYTATTHKTTVINLTNHAYFNLNGHNMGSCGQHWLKINAHNFTPIDKNSIPTGQIQAVKNTPLDFSEGKKIDANIDFNNQQILFGQGYDHNFVLNQYNGSLQLAAEAIGNLTGIKLQVFTTEPGLQFYIGTHLNIENLGKNKASYLSKSGFCLETQHFPDSPNQPNFPSTVLKVGDVFKSTTVYKLLA